MEKYDHTAIEKAAREKWAGLDLYSTDLSNESKDPYYLLVEFPYPSGDLHIGHWYAFAVTDIYARMLRARGKNVLFPIGFDAFGLPAENAAIKNNVDPKEWTYKNIERMKEQLASMGASFDWSKEVLTCDPGYYQWTQWLFAKFFEQGLAERRLAAVKWCPKDQTVLANEQVIDGACDRCGTPVEEKQLTQWFLKITDYAERLLKGLDDLPWREEIKEAQRAWIGKSEGARISFALKPHAEPTFYQFFEPGKVKEGEPYVERDAILAIVKHWSEDKYLGLKWKKVEWETFVTGGIEGRQTSEEAARSEIAQETGYKNLKLVKKLGRMHSKFFHVPKNQNRFAHFDLFYFELEDGEREELADDEKAIHDVVWLSPEEIEQFRLPSSHRYTWDLLRDGKMPVDRIEVFTTRPDTIFGATALVLAPEHPAVSYFIHQSANSAEIDSYVRATAAKTERERSENKDKTGVRIEGVVAVHPATKEEIPVFVADFVLGSYGTGALMAVPAHDERDFEFAQKMGLPIRHVVMPVFLDTKNPPQEGKDNTVRDMVLSIVYNPKTKKYLTLKWKDRPWRTFITGGVEGAESRVEAAKREIAEETGYTNVQLLRSLGMTEAHFFAAHKDVNRVTHAEHFLFELIDQSQSDISEEEKNQYDIEWLSFDELKKNPLQHAEAETLLYRLETGKDHYAGAGTLGNSGEFTNRNSEEAKWEIVAAVGGERATQYRLRDWLVSRQRYWGCPIPIVYDPDGKPHAIPAEHLPWLLPTDVDFTPSGKAPLASSKELQERVTNIFGKGWTPEYDTLDTFVDSSWYFLRYLDSKDSHDFSDMAMMKKWMPVDRYSGGSEHTTMHLFYARFWTMALYDLSLVPVEEPFRERFNRGLIMGPDGQKMSKSKGNVVNPDEFVHKYGTDAVRVYLAFIGPYNEPGSYPWSLEGVAAMRRFLERVIRIVGLAPGTSMMRRGVGIRNEPLEPLISATAKKIAGDGDKFKFNTAVATLMTLLNEMKVASTLTRTHRRDFLVMLAPFAPHLAEHLWEQLGGQGSVHQQAWPEYDTALVEESAREVVVQVNGKRRGSLTLAADTPESDAITEAHTLPTVIAALGGKEPKRVVYVPGKILNLVV